MDPLVSIIIPTYNRQAKLKRCLNSLLRASYGPFEIIIVDNASTDKTNAMIERLFPQTKLIKRKTNGGAVIARNEGIKQAVGDLLCFVDSDNVFDPNFLKKLVELAQNNSQAGLVAPKMYYLKEPNRIWFAGNKVNLLTSRTKYIGLNEIDRGQYNRVKETDHAPNVWLVKREIIGKIGMMDPRYVMSYGEADWSMRIKLNGYKVLFCPEALVYHDIAIPTDLAENVMVRSTAYRIYYFARNRIIFMKKFAPLPNFLIFLLLFNPLFLCSYCLIFIRYAQLNRIRPYLKGFAAGIKILPKIKKYHPKINPAKS